MPESHAEPEVTEGAEKDRLESSLQKLWLKARRLSEILLNLKNENESLRRRVEELEGKEQQLSKKLQGTEQELLQCQSNGTSMFTHEEKEAFVQKIRELITKINSRL